MPLPDGIVERAVAQREIETAFEQIEGRIRKPQIEAEAGIAGEKFGQQRRDVELCESARGGEPDRALGPRAAMPERGHGRIALRQDFAREGQEFLTFNRD